MIGDAFVPATSHVMFCSVVPWITCGTDCDVTRNGPASGATVTLVWANPMPPPPILPSRAVRRNVIVRSRRKPTQSAVGSHSEKHSRVGTGTVPVAGAVRAPARGSAFVLSARICPMSGNTRVGLLVARFRPGELYFSESSSGMSAPTAS